MKAGLSVPSVSYGQAEGKKGIGFLRVEEFKGTSEFI